MYSIPVACNSPGERYPHAPFLSAKLSIALPDGRRFESPHAMNLLVDTGADHTILDPATGGIQAEVLRFGTKEEKGVGGVGGAWPTRYFLHAASLTVLVEGESARPLVARIPLPKLSVMTPYAEVVGDGLREVLGPVARGDRRLQGRTPRLRACRPMPALLGRDLFFANGLRLEWDPRGVSRILFADEPGFEAVVEERMDEAAP